MRRATCFALIPLLLTACASGLPGLRPLSYATPGESRLFVSGDPCIHAPKKAEAAGIAAAFLVGAASKLLDNFGTALTEAAKGGALPTSTALANIQLKPGEVPQCLVLVRGSFTPRGRGDKAVVLANLLWKEDDPATADMKVSLNALHIPALYRLDHLIELQIASSKNGKALTFAPVFVLLNQSIDGDAKGDRDLSIAVKFARVGSDGVGGAVIIADRKIGISQQLAPEPNGRFVYESPWFGTFHQASVISDSASEKPPSTPEQSRASSTRGATIFGSPVGSGGLGSGGLGSSAGSARAPQSPGSFPIEMQSRAQDAVPVTVTATVVETRPTREGLAFIASVFNGVRPKIDEAIRPLIDSEARSTAAVAEAASALNAEAEYAAAEGDARAALVTYCRTASREQSAAGKIDRITKSQNARTAQIKANISAIKAERRQPYGALIAITDEIFPASNQAICSAV